MTSYYKHIYASLRSAMIDRDHGDSLDEAVLVDFKSAQVALKKEIPSAALLIAYSMLYYPSWLSGQTIGDKTIPIAKPVEHFIGGIENYAFPLLFNIHMAMIAVAVGCYAKLWTVEYTTILETIMVKPNMDNPLVLETMRLIDQEHLTYKEAREVFIGLMQDERYASGILLADDYIANVSFIAEASVSVDGNPQEQIDKAIKVDLSEDFGRVKIK